MDRQLQKKLLVVDDIELNRLILSDLFSDEYEVLEAENGKVALDMIEDIGDQLSVVLLDIVMPVMDGFAVLERMNETGKIKTLPVILITGENDDTMALNGYSLGVSDLINKPFNPDIVARRVSNTVQLYAHQQELERRLQEQKDRLEAQAERLRQTNLFVIDALSTTVEFRSLESGDHIKRVRVLTKALLEEVKDEYGLEDTEIEAISNASALHDVGKVAIPDAILLKPGPLTDEEFEVMKGHCVQGCKIIASLNYTQDMEYYKYCYEICRSHHERWDGRGYPDGLVGEEVPIWAQATGLADVYDALTSTRVYKGAYSHERAVEMILNNQCGSFNPKLMDAFLRIGDLFRELVKVRDPGRIAAPKE